MKNIKEYLKTLDKTIRTKQPKTMDEFISLVFNVPNGKTYGYTFEIVKYMGMIQGVRVEVTTTKKTHTLPKDKAECYSVTLGMDDYIKAGWKVVNDSLIH